MGFPPDQSGHRFGYRFSHDGQAGLGGIAVDYWRGDHSRAGIRPADVAPGSNEGAGDLTEGTDNPKTLKVLRPLETKIISYYRH